MQTSLDREIRVFHDNGHFPLDRRETENELLFRFQQQAQNYILNPPSVDDRVGWLALMQHLGVPTRLLDWTGSPYVALYFAVEEKPQGARKNNHEQRNADKEQPCSAVWAINLDWLEQKSMELLGGIPDDPKARINHLNGLLDEQKQPLIVRIDPLHGNERMFAQQGFFLWKLFAETPYFDHILISTLIKPDIPPRPVIKKIRVCESHRIEFLEQLRRMNIHRASLYPGIDGFCQALKVDLQIKVEHERRLANQLNRENALMLRSHANRS